MLHWVAGHVSACPEGVVSQQPETASELAALVHFHRDEIVSAAVGVLRSRGGPRYRAQPPGELHTLVASAVNGLVSVLRTGAYTFPDQLGASIIPTHLSQGFDIGEEIEALLLLRESVLPFLWRYFPADSIERHKNTALLDDFVRGMSARFSHDFAEAMRRQLQEQQQRTELILRVVQAATSSPDLDLALERVAEGMAAALGAGFCGLYLLDPERGLLVPRAAVGDLAAPRLELFRLYRLDPQRDPLLGDVLTAGQPMAILDARTDLRLSRETATAFGVRSVLAVPIEIGARVLGLAVIATLDELHEFDPREIDLAHGMASACALAIENGHLFEETRRRLAESESLQKVTAALLRETALEEVLDIVCSEARQLTGAADSAVLLLEEDRLRIVRSTMPVLEDPVIIPLSGPWTGEAVRTGEPQMVNDMTGENSLPEWKRLTSLLSAPLKVAGSAMGALNVVNKPGGFTPEDQRIISLFADQAAIAIQNARLRQQGERLAVVEERQRLSRDLHDSVTQSIFGVTLYGEAIADQLAAGKVDRASEFVEKLRSTAQESLREMRLLVFELRPPVLEQEGLVAALQARLDSVETRGGLTVKLEAEGCPSLPPSVEQELYRLAQEALNNVLKHSEARRVEVDLTLVDGGKVRLEIRDDGRGFDLEAARLKGGMGLLGMEERARRLGGVLRVESAPERGSSVTVEVPVDMTSDGEA